MGLDMYAYRTSRVIDQLVDFDCPFSDGNNESIRASDHRIAYWRKHPNLYGWMRRLYREKSGTDFESNGPPGQVTAEDSWRYYLDGDGEKSGTDFEGVVFEFNNTPVQVTAEDLDQLEQDVDEDNLPLAYGLFFGESTPEDKKRDKEFIVRARQALSDGDTVYFLASW